MSTSFTHHDGEQRVVFGPEALDAAAEVVEPGYVLLTTARASASAPKLAERAGTVVEVPHGLVEEVAGDLRAQVAAAGSALVALGGGRVVDVAKAIAAAEGLPGPVAVPTSLSGAEMTGVHRHAPGVPDGTPRVRASVVLNDPGLSASQPVAGLAASSANALGHAVTALVSSRSTPLAAAAGREAIEHLAAGWGQDEPDRATIALGALLAGWAVDRGGLGPHHALAQTAVRMGEVAHADANAAILPHSIALARHRGAAGLARADAAAGRPVEELAIELQLRAGAFGLGLLAGDPALLDRAAELVAGRAELDRIPPRAALEEVRALLRTAAGAPPVSE